MSVMYGDDAPLKGRLLACCRALLVVAAAFSAAACGGGDEAAKHNDEGVRLSAEGRFDEAIREFDAAIELEPHLAPAYANRGVTHFELGNFEQGLADLDRAIAIDPHNASYHVRLGIAYADLGNNPEQARRELETAHSLASDPFKREIEQLMRERGFTPRNPVGHLWS